MFITMIDEQDKKLCPICNTSFSRPKGKSNKVWEAQKCCGKDCSAIYRRKKTVVNKQTLRIRKDLNPGERRFVR